MLTLGREALDTACRPANARYPVGAAAGLGWVTSLPLKV